MYVSFSFKARVKLCHSLQGHISLFIAKTGHGLKSLVKANSLSIVDVSGVQGRVDADLPAAGSPQPVK